MVTREYDSALTDTTRSGAVSAPRTRAADRTTAQAPATQPLMIDGLSRRVVGTPAGSSVRVGGDDLPAVAGSEGPPRLGVNRVLDGVDRAVAEEHVDAPGVRPRGRQRPAVVVVVG